MPSMANITVKKADGTTDVVFNAMAPSSGDSVAAVWRAESLGDGVSANRPRFEMRTRNNGDRTARRADFYYTAPAYADDPNTGLTKVYSNVPANITITLPTNIPDSDLDDFIAYLTGLLGSSLVKSALKSGFAPT